MTTPHTETLRDYILPEAIKEVDLLITGTGITQKQVLASVEELIHFSEAMEVRDIYRASARNIIQIKITIWSLLTNQE